MEYEFAPLEGITDAVYRRTHVRHYPGVARYYTPFISPTHHHVFTPRDLRELAAENNPGLALVPQLLTKNADDFLWAANALADMGYREVNLNLGCPSGTVTAKGKGAGFLARPDELDAFLGKIYAAAPLRVSVKTRLGIERPEEFIRLLSIFNRYPVARLIIHPRTRAEQYDGPVHRELFAYARENTSIPLCFNGELKTPDDIAAVAGELPGLPAVMLGRGLVADPALVRRANGIPGDKETLRRFHDDLCAAYPVVFGGENQAMHRMKAIWFYMLRGFTGAEGYRKRLVKTKKWPDFLAVADEIFARCDSFS